MTTEYHAFVDGEAGRCGAIIRHFTPTMLRTRTVFRMGDEAPVYLVDHTVTHDGTALGWSRFDYHCPTHGVQHCGLRHDDGTVTVDGIAMPHLTGAAGAYGEQLMLTQLLSSGDRSLSYTQFDEAEPATAESATLTLMGVEQTAVLDGWLVEAERVQLAIDGRPTNPHWCRDGVVVKSDWCGAQSFLVEALCAGIDSEVAGLIRDFAGRGPMTSPITVIQQADDPATAVLAYDNAEVDLTEWQAGIRKERELMRTAPRSDWALYEAIQLVRSISTGASWVMAGLRPAEAGLADDFYVQLDSLEDWTTSETMGDLVRWQDSLGVTVVDRVGVPPLGPYSR